MKFIHNFDNYLNKNSLKKLCFGLFLLSFLVYFLLGFSVVKRRISANGDEHEYLLIAHSIVYDCDIDLKNNYLNQDYRSFLTSYFI